jgi:glycosyltransferase involved in cell wall biosynthesis
VNNGDGQVVIVIPCFNEARNLESLISQLESEIEIKKFKVILVDNGSTDDSAVQITECLKDLDPQIRECFQWIQLAENVNYGGGIKSGINISKSEYVGWFHADLQFSAAEISKLIRHLDSSTTLVKGARKGRPVAEKIFTGGMSFFASILFQRVCRDINGQPTIYRRDFLSFLEESPDNFSFDAYCYIQAKVSRVKIKRVKVKMLPRLYGKSHWNSGLRSQLQFSSAMIRTLVNFRAQKND